MTRRPSDQSPNDWIGPLYDQTLTLHQCGDDPVIRLPTMRCQVFSSRRRADTYDPTSSIRRAVRNECYSALRRRRRERTTPDEPLLETVAAKDEKPDERMAIEQAIRTLPVDHREVLHLKVFEGLTFQEIAVQLGESINTVASRYRYAIEKMRGQLGRSRT